MQKDRLWWAVKSPQGFLSAVYELRAFTADALSVRNDRLECKLVRVKVEYVCDAETPAPTKKPAKRRKSK